MSTLGTWYPPSAGTGVFLCNPPFMTPPIITIAQVRQQDGDVLWRICYGGTCRESPDWWQVTVWLEQFRRLMAGEPITPA